MAVAGASASPWRTRAGRRRLVTFVCSATASRRVALGEAAAAAAALVARAPAARAAEAAEVARAPEVTARVFLDFASCAEAGASERLLGDKGAAGCGADRATPLGRVVLGLYGESAPGSVAQLLKLAEAGAYGNTVVNRVVPGQFVAIGRQGSDRLGELEFDAVAKVGLPKNADIVRASAFALKHRAPGTVSLAVGANDDDPVVTLRSGYRPTELLITTGPAPQPGLDGDNIVVGVVLEGLDVISQVSLAPTYKPSSVLQQYNAIAAAVGDDRAARARRTWSKPKRPIVIRDIGVLPA